MAGRRWLSWIASLSLIGSLLVLGGGVAHAAPAVPPLTPVTPGIAGTAQVGKTLTAKPGTWQPAPVTLAYQWYRSGAQIAGATAPTYLLVAADKGKTITVRVAGAKEGYAPAAKTSQATKKVAAGTLGAVTPKISGSAKVSKTLTVNPGTWKPAPVTLKIQWYRSGKAISKATKTTYTLGAADQGKRITVKVTGSKAGYNTVAKTSKQTGKAGAGSLTAVAPTISGDAVVGKTLTAKRGTWQPAGVKFSQQWYRSGKKISKATKSTYKLVSADKGKKITVKVTGSKKGYKSTSKTSAATKPVVLSTTGATPTISGYLVVSGGLTANPGKWSPSTVTLSYRWYANGTAIPGATQREFFVTAAQIGKRITVAVTGKRAGYATVTKTSKPTAAVSPDGVYFVGTDLRAGDYTAKGGTQCFWWRLSSLSVDITTAERDTPGVLGMGPIHNGQAIVTVSPSDSYFVTTGCGQWTPLPTTPAFRSTMPDGDYKVNLQVKPGVWRSTGITSECYVELGSGFAGTDEEVIGYIEPTAGQTTGSFEVLSTDVRVSSFACGTWQFVSDPPTNTTRHSNSTVLVRGKASSGLTRDVPRFKAGSSLNKTTSALESLR